MSTPTGSDQPEKPSKPIPLDQFEECDADAVPEDFGLWLDGLAVFRMAVADTPAAAGPLVAERPRVYWLAEPDAAFAAACLFHSESELGEALLTDRQRHPVRP